MTHNEHSPHPTPCQVRDPDIWFSFDPATQHYAASLCRECPVRQECLQAALHGATDEQREALIAAAARANERARDRARADMDRIVDAPERDEE